MVSGVFTAFCLKKKATCVCQFNKTFIWLWYDQCAMHVYHNI